MSERWIDPGLETTLERIVRERTIAECLEALSLAAWRHEGDDSYSKTLDKGARDQSRADYDAISALRASPPPAGWRTTIANGRSKSES